MNPIAAPTSDSPRFSAASLRWTLLGAPLLILFAAYLLTSSHLTATPQVTTDDWRRTANGWERVHSWPTATSRSWSLFGIRNEKVSAPTVSPRAVTRYSRLDTHPAALALAQLLASVFALTLFRNAPQSPLRLSSLFEAIYRSFRSSAFGS